MIHFCTEKCKMSYLITIQKNEEYNNEIYICEKQLHLLAYKHTLFKLYHQHDYKIELTNIHAGIF
jgi:hypothetical protein